MGAAAVFSSTRDSNLMARDSPTIIMSYINGAMNADDQITVKSELGASPVWSVVSNCNER